MKLGTLSLLFVSAFTTAGAALAQQPLVCPVTSAAGPCEAFHYHVQMYRPDTRGFAELVSINQFSSQAACERAREVQSQRNVKLVEFFRTKGETKYEADRFGPCHCDASDPAQRTAHLRLQEEIRLRVRERLIDEKLTTDSELMRVVQPSPAPMLATPKLMPLPPLQAPAAQTAENSTNDLHATKAVDATQAAVASLDHLPLVDVLTGASEAPAQAPPIAEERVVEQPAPSAEELAPAQDAAEKFISYETERIQNVVKASAAIQDETTKEQIFEACLQRMNLLSNLRMLIEGSGVRSRLANLAAAAQTEEERLDVVAKLFGSDITRHWAPRDAADVILTVNPEVAAEPERALRDSSGRFSEQQKKRALYVLLAQSQPTEDQRLWLTSVIDRFLQ
ncbi:MAG TPA: hypothetical protein VF618_24820 [Thermoanaerobaculia bacterium]